VGEDTQDELAPLGLMSSRGQRGAEATLVLAEAPLDVPALVVEHARKALPEGSPIGCLRPAPAGVAAVQGDDAPGDTNSSRQRRWLCSASKPASTSTVPKAMMLAAWRMTGVKSGGS